MKKIAKVFIFIAILVFGFLLRKKDHVVIPIPGQSMDEYSYSWVGLSLLKVCMPVGMSGIPGYKNRTIKYINVDRYQQVIPSNPLEINYPWMDHPPLLPLLTGGYAYFKNVKNFESVSVQVIRKPMLLLGVISLALVFIYVYQSSGFVAAVFSGIFYATTPLIVLSSRMVQGENALIPLFLLVLIFSHRYSHGGKKVNLYLAGVFAGLSTLVKLSGISSYLFVLIYLFLNTKKPLKTFLSEYLYFLLVASPITLMFFVYGVSFGLENFINIFKSSADRFYGIGPSLLLELFKSQRLTQHKYITEPIIFSAWIIFFSITFKKINSFITKTYYAPVLFMLSYLCTFIFFGSQPYGWYSFPLWPFLCILLGIYFGKIITQTYTFGAFILSILALGGSLTKIIDIGQFQQYSNYWRFTMPVLLIFSVLYLRFPKLVVFHKTITIVVIAVTIAINIYYMLTMTQGYWWNNIS